MPNFKKDSPSDMLRQAWGLNEEEMALVFNMADEEGKVGVTATVEEILRSLDNVAFSRFAQSNGEEVVDEDGEAVELPSRWGEQELVRRLKRFIDDHRTSKLVN